MLAPPIWTDNQARSEAFTLNLDGIAVDSELGVKPGSGFYIDLGGSFLVLMKASNYKNYMKFKVGGYE